MLDDMQRFLRDRKNRLCTNAFAVTLVRGLPLFAPRTDVKILEKQANYRIKSRCIGNTPKIARFDTYFLGANRCLNKQKNIYLSIGKYISFSH